MAIVLEDGTGSNPAANSYQDTDDLIAYAALRGVDLALDPVEDLEVLLIKAMDYLEGQRERYKGHKTSADQPLQWPRQSVWGVELPETLTPDDEIPSVLKYAQLTLAIDAITVDLMPNQIQGDKGAVIKSVVGPIETTYDSKGIKQQFKPALSKADALLSPLYMRNGLFAVRT